MRVLAIGATGLIGPHVVHILIEQRHDVAVLHRGETGADLSDEVHHIHGNRDALADAQPAVERFSPEIVIDVIP